MHAFVPFQCAEYHLHGFFSWFFSLSSDQTFDHITGNPKPAAYVKTNTAFAIPRGKNLPTQTFSFRWGKIPFKSSPTPTSTHQRGAQLQKKTSEHLISLTAHSDVKLYHIHVLHSMQNFRFVFFHSFSLFFCSWNGKPCSIKNHLHFASSIPFCYVLQSYAKAGGSIHFPRLLGNILSLPMVGHRLTKLKIDYGRIIPDDWALAESMS